ncbi:MAG: hypothetical protein IID61_09430 [SAR324 cluster bacterium]|nr:hypothetical protein [SAR324 cluster bacterium]
MFKLLHNPDEADADLANVISEASNRLDVGEFQLFQLSYESWYGRHPAPEVIEPFFFTYLYHDKMPAWARHYARKIIELDDRGGLVGNDPSYHRFDKGHQPPAKWIGWVVMVTTLGVVALFLLLMSIVGRDFVGGRCMFPPCP